MARVICRVAFEWPHFHSEGCTPADLPLIGNAGRLPAPDPRDAESGPGGHRGGEDVVRVAIQVLTGPVVAHGGARVCVAGGDLDIPEVNTSVETGLAKVKYGAPCADAPW
jgi:hypothetical protein